METNIANFERQDRQTIGGRLRAAREEKGWSRRELSRRVNWTISDGSIANYELSRRLPSPTVVRLLAGALGERAAYLMGVEDDVSISDEEWRAVRALRVFPGNLRESTVANLEAMAIAYSPRAAEDPTPRPTGGVKVARQSKKNAT